MEGAVQRVRPKMMTVAAIMGGLLPIMWTTGTGADVMKRIAAPMIGGMVSSTHPHAAGDSRTLCPLAWLVWPSRAPSRTHRYRPFCCQEQESIGVSERQNT